MKTKHVLIIVAVVVVLYLLYKYNGSEKFSNDVYAPVASSQQVASASTSSQQASGSPTLGVYYTEWCGYSQQFLSQLKNGLQSDIEKTGTKVVLVDCEKDKQTCAKYNVEGYPTLLLHTSKGPIPYNGSRSAADITAFIKANQ